MMKFAVHVIADAEQDLTDIYWYVAPNDGPVKANILLDGLGRTILRLETMPLRDAFLMS